MSRDEIVLTLPRERPFFNVAHLVFGGLAVRLDLSGLTFVGLTGSARWPRPSLGSTRAPVEVHHRRPSR